MFQKIVSQLSFSPALVGQLAFYAKRLRKEEATRRLGLVFLVLALVVQSLAVFQPPEAANAASNNDFIYGGLGPKGSASINAFLGPYDRNERHLQDIMNYFGITRAEIAGAHYGTFKVGTNKSYGYENRAGSRTIAITDAQFNTVQTIYGRPMTIWGNEPTDSITGFIGNSAKIGWFAIVRECGNLVTVDYPTPPTPPPAPTAAKFEYSKTAVNASQGAVDATKTTAKEKDRITFTLTTKNTGGTAKDLTFEDNIGDTLEYAKLLDNGGGVYNKDTRMLSWPTITLKPGETQVRTFTVQLLESIPATPTGISDPSSYDCKIENAFYESSLIFPVTCPTPKVIEKVVPELPKTGPQENMLFAGIILAVVTFFYLRSRQLGAEVRLIRRDLNGGTL